MAAADAAGPVQVEAELQQLEKAEALEYLQSLGVSEGGLRSLIQATYEQLGLATYFTTGVCCLPAAHFATNPVAPQACGRCQVAARPLGSCMQTAGS